jgi:ribonucleoside-diphosphate reductase alpha chain
MKYEEALKSSIEYFGGAELPAKVWLDKYALRTTNDILLEATPDDMHRRIAYELSRVEQRFEKPYGFTTIYNWLKNFGEIIPQGSPMYGIGNKNRYVTLSNCYVVSTPEDSYGGIHKTDEEITQISKRRGGVGLDISKLRPSGTRTTNSSKHSTGIISFMERYSNSIREVGQCIEKNQRVLTLEGIIPIKDVVSGQFVWTKEGWVRVNKVLKNGKNLQYFCIPIKYF